MRGRTFLFMGRPGAGKGTQARLLAMKIGAELYSSGSRLREIAKGEGFVNRKVGEVMARGDLLPAWFSSHLFIEALLNLSPEDSIVFEGACRTLSEARMFDESARWLERSYQVVFLAISDAEVEKRLNLRRDTEGRSDDASDSIGRRIMEYKEKTAAAVEFFALHGSLVEINGEQLVETVHRDVLEALGLAQ